MQAEGEQFPIKFYLLPLDSFDVVLGIQWLKTLGPIVWDFKALTMDFLRKGKQVTLHGRQQELKPQVYCIRDTRDSSLELVLVEFSDLFHAPNGLLPIRSCDHRICLFPGSSPVVVRSYRYPHVQKDEIEK